MTISPDSIMRTEDRNPRTRNLDLRTSLEIVEMIHQEDTTIAAAVGASLPRIAEAVDGIVARLKTGGRLFYVGAGTSGRLGVLDAVECPPTFGVPHDLVVGILAGGYAACYSAVESAEDSEDDGREALCRAGCTQSDAVVGIAASGRTPFTCGAIRYAGELGAFTVGIANNPESELGAVADVCIEAVTGPEVVTGSTRMKAGTAQKMVLNMISTATMVRLGLVYDNLMINVHLNNYKLRQRGLRIVQEILGVDRPAAEAALIEAGDVRTAVVMLASGCTAAQARKRLAESPSLRHAIHEDRESHHHD